jgi:hypothetical protein
LQEFLENANARRIFFEKTAEASSKRFSNIEVLRHFGCGVVLEEKERKRGREGEKLTATWRDFATKQG